MNNLRRIIISPVVLLAFTALLNGCSPRITRISISSQPGRQADFGLLLHRIVTDDRINTAELIRSRVLLDRYLSFVSTTGPSSSPEQFPDAKHRLAYLINCHNAMMLRGLIALAENGSFPEKISSSLDREFAFVIDGISRTAADVKTNVTTLAEADWRVHLALYNCRMDGPPLPKYVFVGNTIDAQLDQTARDALKSEQVVKIDHGENKRLLLWRGLFEIRRQLISDYERRLHTSGATMLNVLLEWSDRFQRETLNSAVGYPIEVIPVDNRVNAKRLSMP